MKLPRFDDLSGLIGDQTETSYSRNGLDFLVSGLSARTKLRNVKWLLVWFYLNRGTPWRLVGNFDRKAELSITMTDEATDDRYAKSIVLLPLGKMSDTRQLVGTDLEKLIPTVETAIEVIFAHAQTRRRENEQKSTQTKRDESEKTAASLENLKKRGL